MVAELRVALVGGRRTKAHVAGFRSMPQCAITAVCDVDRATVNALGDDLGVSEGGRFLHYDDLLERAKPDLVVLGTPMHLHVPQAIQALDLGVHVLSEVTAAVDLEQCRQLVQAVRRSRAQYMMAENFCYLKPNALLQAMAVAGRFGKRSFAEGEYLADCKPTHHLPDGSPSWRATWQVGKRGCTYGTHHLGPALEFFGPEARVVTVNCIGSGVHTDPEHPHDDTCIMLCHLNVGGLIKVRLDMMSNRPYVGRYFSLQGTRGCYEAPRGFGDDHKIWLGEETAPTSRAPREWTSLWDYADEYLPEPWRHPPEEATRSANGGAEYFMVRDFVHSILEGRTPPVDVHRALDYTIPGLISEQSIVQDGAPLSVPDSREW